MCFTMSCLLLVNICEYVRFSANAPTIQTDLLKVTRDSHQFTDTDVSLSMDVIENVLNEKSVFSSQQMSENMVESISNLLNAPDDAIANNPSKASERCIFNSLLTYSYDINTWEMWFILKRIIHQHEFSLPHLFIANIFCALLTTDFTDFDLQQFYAAHLY